MISLTPNIYKRDAKFLPLTENKIDTVYVQPLRNEITEFKHVETRDLPRVAPSDKPTYVHYMTCQSPVWNIFAGQPDVAKARVEVLLHSGTTEFVFDTPVEGNVTCNIALEGTSYVIGNKEISYGAYPSSGEFTDVNTSLAAWVYNNRESTVSQLTHEYESQNVFFTPWIKRWTNDNVVSEGNVNTLWASTEAGNISPNYAKWISGSNQLSDALPLRRALPGTQYSDIAIATDIPLAARYIPKTCKVTRTSDRSFIVHWQVPLRFVYLAASRYFGPLGGEYLIDSSAYYDDIKSCTFTLQGAMRNREYEEYAFSLDANSELSDTLINKRPYKFGAAENITTDTRYDSKYWYREIPRLMLEKYKQSKYIFKCKVPGEWCLKNDITIGTKCQVILPDTSVLHRENATAVFEVVTIEKILSAQEFSFSLALMEV